MTNPTVPISFEFFPPKTDKGHANLAETRSQLAAYSPEYFSVTYGAGGSTRDTTRNVVVDLIKAGSRAAPHLSFGGDGEETIAALLRDYATAGVEHIVALRGDLPSGMGGASQLVHANQLVEFIRRETGDQFNILVAAYPEIHPEAESYSRDIHWLGEKFKAGADAAITQYFYSADAYFAFVDACAKAGIHQPIVPGIMPLTNYQNLLRFSDACGADIPRWLRWQLKERADDSEALMEYGLEVVTKLCEQLIAGGAPGLHFYTMNQWRPTGRLCSNLFGGGD